MNNVLISVITVVFNDSIGLEKTINSMIQQSENNYEFIIIDGGSTDDTMCILKRYEKYINYYVSEPDKGIYDAMNKGIRASNGKWINFMNAGDIFASNHILSSIAFDELNKYTLIYGNQINNNKINIPEKESILKIGGTFACHQSMFFNKELLKNELIYDLKYKIFGDYELVNRMYIKYPNSFKYIDLNISIFEGGGVSSKISKQKRIERYTLVSKHYGIRGVIGALIHKIRNLI